MGGRSPSLLVVALVALSAAVSEIGAQPVIDTQYGRISGVYQNISGVEIVAYLGIPFAAPPTGANRFRPPQPHERWNGVRKCDDDKFFHVCPQMHYINKTLYGNEDCLYMNVYVPVEAAKQGPLPVMFWIYGGAYVVGDSVEFGMYRGQHIAAKRGVIMVEFNYRLGALGFLSHPALMAESGTTGNYALQDQTIALEFTYNNIANFGGDQNKITIFGESAGGFSICWHLVSPASSGFFISAIMESGSCSSAEFFFDLPRAYTYSEDLIEFVGCKNESDVLDCLRSADVGSFLTVREWPSGSAVPPLAPVFAWGPTIDGSPLGLLDRPINLLKAGQFSRVPVIMGTNKDEGTIFVPVIALVTDTPMPPTPAEIPAAMAHFFNSSTVDLLLNTMYPEQANVTEFKRIAQILRDYFFLCGTRESARAISSFGVPVYLYQFNYNMTNFKDYPIMGNYHGSDLVYVFENYFANGSHPLDLEEQRLSASFQIYWTNMAKYGGPNFNLGPDQAVWPRYNETSDMHLNLVVPTLPGANLNKDLCDQWRNIFPIYY